MVIATTVRVTGLSIGIIILKSIVLKSAPSTIAASMTSRGSDERPAEYIVTVKPDHSQTEPSISENSAVSGYIIHDLARNPKPKILSRRLTTPRSLSKLNCISKPPTIIGMTIPKKINDLIILPPLTYCRKTANKIPIMRVKGR